MTTHLKAIEYLAELEEDAREKREDLAREQREKESEVIEFVASFFPEELRIPDWFHVIVGNSFFRRWHEGVDYQVSWGSPKGDRLYFGVDGDGESGFELCRYIYRNEDQVPYDLNQDAEILIRAIQGIRTEEDADLYDDAPPEPGEIAKLLGALDEWATGDDERFFQFCIAKGILLLAKEQRDWYRYRAAR